MKHDIERILGKSPEARDSDGELIIQLLQERAEFTPHQLEVLKDFKFETVRRVRQKLQEDGQYQPSPAVGRQRRLKGYIVQQQMPSTKPEKVQPLLEQQPKAIHVELDR